MRTLIHSTYALTCVFVGQVLGQNMAIRLQ